MPIYASQSKSVSSGGAQVEEAGERTASGKAKGFSAHWVYTVTHFSLEHVVKHCDQPTLLSHVPVS